MRLMKIYNHIKFGKRHSSVDIYLFNVIELIGHIEVTTYKFLTPLFRHYTYFIDFIAV